MWNRAPNPLLAALCRDRRGVISLYYALILGVTTLLAVGALDMIRAHMARSRVAMAVDSAILAAGRSLGQDTWATEGVAFFNANMEDSTGVTTALTTSDFKPTDQGWGISEVTVSTTAKMSLLSGSLGNVSAFNIAVEATARRNSPPAEVVMVLDNTGSMLTNNNIEALRSDAKTLISILSNGATTGTLSKVTVGIVPYAASVNPGIASEGLITGSTVDPSGGPNWKGCVIEPAGYALADAPPATAVWRKYQAPVAVDNAYTAGVASSVKDAWTYGNSSTGPNVGCPTPITPLTNDVATLNSALTAMQAWSRGGTISDIGLAWGLRVLSPSAPFTGGSAFNGSTPKVLVMMTDGEAGYFKLTGTSGSNKVNNDVISDYAGYGRVDQYGLLGMANMNNETYVKNLSSGAKDTAKNTARTVINGNITTMCNRLRNLGVRVYTITFGNVPTDTKNIYTSCAYDSSYYYDAPTQAKLQTAFESIGGALTELVIVK